MSEQSGLNQHWERQTLQKLLLEHLIEKKRARRWGIFFKSLIIGFIILGIWSVFFKKDIAQPAITAQAHTALIDIYGEISAEQFSNADDIRDALRLAFKNRHVRGIVLRINSPGGSPVQARQIYDEIRSLRTEYPEIPLYATIEELGTSAAYLIASAADNIYADKTSLIGSIGVRIDSFGFVEGMKKIGIERRLYTAGKNKDILDPFLPRDPQDDAFIEGQLKLVHQVFIENVRQGRGNRLKENPDIFSGLFWVGEEALNLGLIDGYGDADYVARSVIKAEQIVDYTPSQNLIERIVQRIGASFAVALIRNVHWH